MSAHAALDSYIESLQILARSEPGDRTDDEREADARHRSALIDAYAHELAEQQREWARAGNVSTTEAYRAADLIDPKAQRASTEGDTP